MVIGVGTFMADSLAVPRNLRGAQAALLMGRAFVPIEPGVPARIEPRPL
jgi:hypothetical protein